MKKSINFVPLNQKKSRQMKNLFAIVALVGMFALVSCGGSKKDDEKAKQDSLKKDSLMKDSLAKDSIKKAEELAAQQDSIAADSAKKDEKKTK